MEVILGYEEDMEYIYTLTNNQWLFKQNFASQSRGKSKKYESTTQVNRYTTKKPEVSGNLSHMIVKVKWGEQFEQLDRGLKGKFEQIFQVVTKDEKQRTMVNNLINEINLIKEVKDIGVEKYPLKVLIMHLPNFGEETSYMLKLTSQVSISLMDDTLESKVQSQLEGEVIFDKETDASISSSTIMCKHGHVLSQYTRD